MAFRDPAPIKLTEVKKEVVRLDDDKQNKNSSNLTTESKNIEGAINELKTKSDTLTSNGALKSTQIIAGDGLQGGGTLEQNRTLSIKGANDSITASSSGLAVNTYNGVDSTSTTRPASANALKTTYDKLVTVESTSNSKLSKAGDTMSGDISFSNQGTSFVGLKGSVGDDDGWRIVGGSTVGNVGELEIATGFSGNQPIYVRQYNGANYSTIARTLTLLDVNGNTTFPGALTASNISGALTGNASTATSLQTARTLTIGNTGKTFNGGSDVSWSLSEIGALPLTGGTLTISEFTGLTIKRSDANGSAISYNNSDGQLGSAGFLSSGEFVVNKTSDTLGDYMKISSSDVTFGSKTVSAATFSGALSGNASTATILQTERTLTIGNTGKSFNGSANVSWSLSEIGAAASSHTHNYLPTSGGTISGNLTVTGAIVANGNVTAYSDRRLKSNITKIENSLDKICSIGGYTFNMLGTRQRQTGVIAQELEKVLPEAVIKNDNGYLSVDYGRVVGLLIEGIKDLKQEINELKGSK